MPKVSVIVPVYNAEKYIEKCARSLFEQTLDDIEYIFVNDCTPDNSIQILKNILKEYPQRKAQVKILNHVQNQGQAGARTTGMKAMTGDFMIHCDSDDWIDLDLYEKMYNKAISECADIVVCDIKWVYYNRIIYDKINIKYNNGNTLLKNYFRNSIGVSLVNKLIKAELIIKYHIYPFEGINAGEDLNVSLRAFLYAKKITKIENVFYYYLQNLKSISHQKTDSLFEEYYKPNTILLCDYLLLAEGTKYNTTCNFIKYTEKRFFIEGHKPNVKKWLSLWPECHKDILKFKIIPTKHRYFMRIGTIFPPLLHLYIKYITYRIYHN